MNRFVRRCRAVVDRLNKSSVDALLVTHLAHLAYLTGFRSSAGVAIVSADSVLLIVDSRYLTVAKELVKSGFAPGDLTIVPVDRSYDQSVLELFAENNWKQVGVESDHLSVRRWLWFNESLRGLETSLVPVEGIVEAERLRKDEDEIVLLSEAGRLISKVIPLAVDLVQPGCSELKIAGQIDLLLNRMGFEDRSFPTIVASGEHSALPHARPSERVIGTGEFVLLDFGGVHSGYCVDVSRTVCLGNANDEMVRIHEAVSEAQTRAFDMVRPGVAAHEIDSAARLVLERNGLAEFFGHATGHGIGLEVHESPRIGKHGQMGTDVIIEPGMVFTVEPGVYIPGLGGVRIEDDVLVTEEGCSVLTEASRELLVP